MRDFNSPPLWHLIHSNLCAEYQLVVYLGTSATTPIPLTNNTCQTISQSSNASSSHESSGHCKDIYSSKSRMTVGLQLQIAKIKGV